MRYFQLLLPALLAVAMTYPKNKSYLGLSQQGHPIKEQLHYGYVPRDYELKSYGILGSEDRYHDLEEPFYRGEESRPFVHITEESEDGSGLYDTDDSTEENGDDLTGKNRGIRKFLDMLKEPKQNHVRKIAATFHTLPPNVEAIEKLLVEIENKLREHSVVPKIIKDIDSLMTERFKRGFLPDELKLHDHKDTKAKLLYLTELEKSNTTKNEIFYNEFSKTFTSHHVIDTLASYEKMRHALKRAWDLKLKLGNCYLRPMLTDPGRDKKFQCAESAWNALSHYIKAAKFAGNAYNQFIKVSKLAGSDNVDLNLGDLRTVANSARSLCSLFVQHADNGFAGHVLHEDNFPGH